MDARQINFLLYSINVKSLFENSITYNLILAKRASKHCKFDIGHITATKHCKFDIERTTATKIHIINICNFNMFIELKLANSKVCKISKHNNLLLLM